MLFAYLTVVTRSTSAADVMPARHFAAASSIMVIMPDCVAAFLMIPESVRSLIGSNTDSGIIENAATQSGMVTMIEDAVAKCRAGITSAAEVLRVTTVR